MKALIDGDVLRYEVGFATETGWKAITGKNDAIPPWDYVLEMMQQRIAYIVKQCNASSYRIYLTKGRTFRYDIAKSRPYKGQRVEHKPWHYDNITTHLTLGHPCNVITQIEADDAMAIDSTSGARGSTIICSRDKDLRQVPGLFYSWELGKQPAYGPVEIGDTGTLELTGGEGKKKDIKGNGFAFFCAQMLMGDKADNIPGAEGVGPVAAFEALEGATTKQDYWQRVVRVYEDVYGLSAQEKLEEQGKLLWIVRELSEDGSPKLWSTSYAEDTVSSDAAVHDAGASSAADSLRPEEGSASPASEEVQGSSGSSGLDLSGNAVGSPHDRGWFYLDYHSQYS